MSDQPTTDHSRRRLGAMLKREIAPSDLVEHAQRHQYQYDQLWVVEDLPYTGGVGQAAAVLGATESVVVGQGIAPAPFRTAAALAMEWATIAAIWPHRFIGGIGHGVQNWMEQIGVKAGSPLTLLEETHHVVAALLEGRILDFAGRYVTAREVGLVFPPVEPPPVFLGVTGPRSLHLSGKVAAGTVLSEGHGAESIRAARKRIAQGASESKRDPVHHHLVVFVSFNIGDPANITNRNPDAPSDWEALADDVDHCGHLLRQLYDAGADTVVLNAIGADIDEQLDLAAQVDIQ